MITGYQQSLTRFIQTDMPQGMARSFDAFKAIFPHIDPVPIRQNVQGRHPVRPESDSRMLLNRRTKLIFRKSVFACEGDHGFKSFPGFHDFSIRPAEKNLTGSGRQAAHQAKMIGMKVGDKKIRPRQINPQSAQTCLHGHQASFSIEPRIDDQISVFSFYHIRVQGFQRAFGKGNFDAIEIPAYFLGHDNLLLIFS